MGEADIQPRPRLAEAGNTNTIEMTLHVRQLLIPCLFVGLNVLDALLTGRLLDLGAREFNPLASPYGTNIVFKAGVSLAIAAIVMRLGRVRLLAILNIAMLGVVLWNGIWLIIL